MVELYFSFCDCGIPNHFGHKHTMHRLLETREEAISYLLEKLVFPKLSEYESEMIENGAIKSVSIKEAIKNKELSPNEAVDLFFKVGIEYDNLCEYLIESS